MDTGQTLAAPFRIEGTVPRPAFTEQKCLLETIQHMPEKS